MERMAISAETRGNGKEIARKLRVAGKIPAVLYGKSTTPQSIMVPAREMEVISKKAQSSSVLVDLSLAGNVTTTLIRDFQADPFKRRLTHVDFQAVGLDEKIDVEVPVRLNGTPKGVKDGGILEQMRRTVIVRCRVSNIPASIEVDVAGLMIGDNVHVNDLVLGEGVDRPKTVNFAIAAVVPPAKEEVVAAAAVTAAPVEGAAAPAEGAAAPAAGDKAAEAAPAKAAPAKKEK